MHIIFVDRTGVHHALIAAHVFIGALRTNDFREIKHFGDTELGKRGNLLYVGQDGRGARVYTLGAGRNQGLAAGVIGELRNILGFAEKDLAVKAISMPGDAVIGILGYIPAWLGGGCLQKLLGRVLIKHQFTKIRTEALAFKAELASKMS